MQLSGHFPAGLVPRPFWGTLQDLLIFSQKLEDHINHVYKVLTVLENARVSLKIRKFQFFRKSLYYLGHMLLP